MGADAHSEDRQTAPALGKVQEEKLDSCRAAGERGPATRRDEGLGETEEVSSGAICPEY